MCRLGIDGTGNFGDARNRRVLAGRRDRLLGRRLVDVREAHLLHGVEVVQVAPVLLEAVRRRQRGGMVAQVVLAELAGGVAKIEQEFGDRRGARAADMTGCREVAAGSCRCAVGTCR